MAGLTAGGRADAEAFLHRLLRLDAAALVRLRDAGRRDGGGPHQLALWARLPWDVLVTRLVEAEEQPAADITVPAAGLLRRLDGGESPQRRDAAWRWRLPASAGTVVERIPPDDIRRIGAAAARTLREAGPRAVGERVLRDALLDHVPIVVEEAGRRVEIPQRLVQAVLRMGFLGAAAEGPREASVAVRIAPGWVGLAGGYGTAWQQIGDPLSVRAATR